MTKKELIKKVEGLHLGLLAKSDKTTFEAISDALETFRVETGGNPSSCAIALYSVLSAVSVELVEAINSLEEEEEEEEKTVIIDLS